jgi:hypothetical protein
MSVVEEKRRLVAHDKMLIDVIKRQAGTLKKAILEGTMNSVEAGATEIDINFYAERSQDSKNPSKATLSIYDDGIGIKSRQDLINHFETFGQPHEASENKIYAQFRMGRGQMFAFGKNIWRTSQFEMMVDVDNMELDYLLKENLPFINGCKIDIALYQNPIDNYSIQSVKSLQEQVKEQVGFVKIPVRFNNEIISTNPEKLNWDFEDDFAYYKFNDTSSLKIYNLGVFVMAKSIKEVGVGGIVVSKRQLKVNFARNDIHESDCVVYKEIKKVIESNKIKKANTVYKVLSPNERINFLCNFRDAVYPINEMLSKRFFRTTQDKWFSWNMIVKENRKWCFMPQGDIVADKAMQMGIAICFDISMKDELGYDGKDCDFFDWLFENYLNEKYFYLGNDIRKELTILKSNYCKDLRSQFSEKYSYVPYEKLKKSERVLVDVMNSLRCWSGRSIKIGDSSVSIAWTDGCSYIAFDRSWLSKLSLSSDFDILNILLVGCHELAHDVRTDGSHNHGYEFYEKYYEVTRDHDSRENPLRYVSKFETYMKNAKIDKKRKEEKEKENKLKEELGLVMT